MAILPVIVAPDPRLKVRSAPVERVDDEVRKLLDDLLETMYAAPGIGLSAVQVGVHLRAIVVDAAREDAAAEEGARAPLHLVNPEIVWRSDSLAAFEEGCLSFPEQFAEVSRPDRVKVSYLDYHGKRRELDAEGLLATCVQHEMDHLDGVLFVDYLSAVRRGIILRKLVKARKLKAKDVA